MAVSERGLDSFANLTNISQVAEAERIWWKEPLYIKVLRLSLEGTVLSLGAIGNAVICWILVRRLGLKSIMNTYLFSLALADFGVLAITCPLGILRALFVHSWPLGQWTCTVLVPIADVFLGASCWSITAIAIERCRHFAGSGIKLYQQVPKKDKILRVLSLWITSFVLPCVPMFFVVKFNPDTKSCYAEWPDASNVTGVSPMAKAYSVTLGLFWYIIPLVLIIISYLAVTRRLRESRRFHNNLTQDNGNSRRNAENLLKQNARAQRILTPLVIIFALTWLPVTSIRLWWAYATTTLEFKYYVLLFDITVFLISLNSATNPIVYAFAKRDFRIEFGLIARDISLKRFTYTMQVTRTSSCSQT